MFIVFLAFWRTLFSALTHTSSVTGNVAAMNIFTDTENPILFTSDLQMSYKTQHAGLWVFLLERQGDKTTWTLYITKTGPHFFLQIRRLFVWLLSIFLGLYGKEVVTAYYWIERIRKKTCTVIDRTGSFRMSRPFQKSICPMLLMTILKIYSLSKLAKECKEPWDFRYSNMYFIENQCL